MKNIRLGVVGLGHRGRAMFRGAANSINGIEAVAACDLNPDLWFKDTHGYGGDHIALAKELPNVKFYDNYDEMLDSANLDMVMIETPAINHAKFCIQALNKGIHVYSDIPSVRTLEEGARLWDAQQKSDALLMTGATTRGWGFVLSLQEIYQKGLIGKPFALEAEYIHSCMELWEETPWRRPSIKWGSMPIRYCTHSLGPLLSIMNEDLRTVSAVTTGSHVTDNEFANDYMCALFQTESGVTVRFTASFINNCTAGLHSYRVFGTKGNFEHLAKRGDVFGEKTMFNSKVLSCADAVTELPVGFSPYYGERAKKYKFKTGGQPYGHGGSDSYLMQLFVEALQNGAKKAPIDLREGLRMTLPGIYAAECVIRNVGKVTIHYPWEKEFADDIRNSCDVVKY